LLFPDNTLSEDTPSVFVTVNDKRTLCGSCMIFLAGITLEDDKLTLYESIFEDGFELELAAITLEDSALTVVVTPSCDAFATDTKIVETNKE
jgi:hypothetical protein